MKRQPPLPPVLLPPILRTFLIGTVLLGLLWGVSEFCCIHLLHLNTFPYNRMILPAQDNFVDYSMFNARFAHFHTRAFFSPALGSPFLYPAPDAILYALIHGVTDPFHHYGVALIMVALPLLLCLTSLLWWGLLRAGVQSGPAFLFSALALVSSYPVYFELNRSNVEFFVWILAGGGVWAFLRNRPWLAAALIGLAGACKLYPYILLGLLLLRKQYRPMFFGILIGAAGTLASLWAVTGDIGFTARQVAEGLKSFQNDYVLTRHAIEIGLDHSLFGFFKWPLAQMPPLPVAAHYLTLYLAVVALGGTLLFFLKLRTMPVSNQITFLTVATILLPPVSYDYTLLQLYTPWAVLVFLAVRYWRAGVPATPGLRHAFYSFAFLLSPQNEFILHAEKLEGQIKCLALVALAFISLLEPFEILEQIESPRTDRTQPLVPRSTPQ